MNGKCVPVGVSSVWHTPGESRRNADKKKVASLAGAPALCWHGLYALSVAMCGPAGILRKRRSPGGDFSEPDGEGRPTQESVRADGPSLRPAPTAPGAAG